MIRPLAVRPSILVPLALLVAGALFTTPRPANAQGRLFAAIHREVPANGDPWRAYFTTRPVVEAQRFGWRRDGVAFRTFLTAEPGMVPVHVETPRDEPHSHYHYSTRSAADASANGWTQLFTAFYAYAHPVPGSVPVWLETPRHAPLWRYNLSTRSREDASRAGWVQVYVAFWVPERAPPGVEMVAEDPPTTVTQASSTQTSSPVAVATTPSPGVAALGAMTRASREKG